MSRELRMRFSLTEVAEKTGADPSTLVVFIKREWICPATPDELDEEDLARVHLIQELRIKFGANDESIPIILHLIDQLYSLRHRMRREQEAQ